MRSVDYEAWLSLLCAPLGHLQPVWTLIGGAGNALNLRLREIGNSFVLTDADKSLGKMLRKLLSPFTKRP
jgi:hypothetical protein